MTKDEVSRLKERIRAEYAVKLHAIEIVEKMLMEQPAKRLESLSHVRISEAPLRERIESLVRTEPKKRWTLAAIRSKIGTESRSTVWKEVRKLVAQGKIKEAKKGNKRNPGEYTWIGSRTRRH